MELLQSDSIDRGYQPIVEDRPQPLSDLSSEGLFLRRTSVSWTIVILGGEYHTLYVEDQG